MDKATYNELPSNKKIEEGDLFEFYFPAKGSIREENLVAEKVFETFDNGKKIMMVRAKAQVTRDLEIFKGKAHFDYSASYDLDYCTMVVKLETEEKGSDNV